MKKRHIFLLVLAFLSFFVINGMQTLNAEVLKGAKPNAKVLVLYFSRVGEQYKIGKTEVGNTSVIANIIAQYLKADIEEIKPTSPYPSSYEECSDIALMEQEAKARPSIIPLSKKVQNYDIIFLGYPIWWTDFPMIIYTILENNNFAGKTIIPFCTHEGSAAAKTVEHIKKAAPKANVLKALAIKGEVAQNKRDEAKKITIEWLKKIELK